MRNVLATLALVLVPLFVTSATAWAEEQTEGLHCEINPKFGFEMETRDPIGEVLCYGNLNLFPVYAAIVMVSDTVLGTNGTETLDLFLQPEIVAYGFAAAFYPTFKSWLITRPFQKMVFRWRDLPYTQDGELKVVNPETGFYLRQKGDVFVHETTNQPATVQELKDNQDFINATTFNRVNNLGASPALLFGSGHVHIDRETAFADPQLLRDFVVDLLNHPGLFLGPLVRDRFSSSDPRRRLGAIRKVIEEFDLGYHNSTEKLSDALRKAGLSRTTSSGAAIFMSDKFKTVELRFPRAQKNAEEVILWAELIKARLNYLAANPGVELKPFVLFRTPAETYRQIKSYVTGAGLEWEPYKRMLPRRWRWTVGKYVDSHQRCEGLSEETSAPSEAFSH